MNKYRNFRFKARNGYDEYDNAYGDYDASNLPERQAYSQASIVTPVDNTSSIENTGNNNVLRVTPLTSEEKQGIDTSKGKIITNHDKTYDYYKVGNRLYTRRKGSDNWIDISDNDLAQRRINNFLNSPKNNSNKSSKSSTKKDSKQEKPAAAKTTESTDTKVPQLTYTPEKEQKKTTSKPQDKTKQAKTQAKTKQTATTKTTSFTPQYNGSSNTAVGYHPNTTEIATRSSTDVNNDIIKNKNIINNKNNSKGKQGVAMLRSMIDGSLAKDIETHGNMTKSARRYLTPNSIPAANRNLRSYADQAKAAQQAIAAAKAKKGNRVLQIGLEEV